MRQEKINQLIKYLSRLVMQNAQIRTLRMQTLPTEDRRVLDKQWETNEALIRRLLKLKTNLP